MLSASKHIFLFISLMIVSVQFNFIWGENAVPLITQVQATFRDSTFRYLYLYDEYAHKTLETKYVKQNEEWKRREQTEWVYNNGKRINQYNRKWNGVEWQLIHQINFTYNMGLSETETHTSYTSGNPVFLSKKDNKYHNGLISVETDSIWQNGTWRILSRNDYTYNVSNLADTIKFTKYHNGIPESWSRINFVYNEFNLIKEQIFAQKQDTSWTNLFKTITYYKPSSDKATYLIQKKWNNSLQKWQNHQNIAYSYDSNQNLKTETYQTWQTQYWKNDLKYEYSYNTDNATTKKTTYMPVYDDFRPSSSINYQNFQYGSASLIEANYEFWGGETGSLLQTYVPYKFNSESVIQFASKIEISYVPIDMTNLPTINDSVEKGTIKVYPNPSIAIFYFNTQLYDVKEWTVSDISGKVILSKSDTHHSGAIDLGDFKPGVYILKVHTTQKTLTQKLIKK